MIDLSVQVNFAIFKTLFIPKIVHLGLINSVPTFGIEQLNIIKRTLFGKQKTQNKTFNFTKYVRIRRF